MTINPPQSLVKCAECGASWLGIEGDDCYWCNKRYEQLRQSERQHLLFPEWQGWSERFDRCSVIDQSVWAETRGLRGKYWEQWERDLTKAVARELITDAERSIALGRNAEWISTHLKRLGD